MRIFGRTVSPSTRSFIVPSSIRKAVSRPIIIPAQRKIVSPVITPELIVVGGGGGETPSNALLNEDGMPLLNEDGSYLLTE